MFEERERLRIATLRREDASQIQRLALALFFGLRAGGLGDGVFIAQRLECGDFAVYVQGIGGGFAGGSGAFDERA